MLLPNVTLRRLVPILIFAIAAHNFEEWLTYPHFGESSAVVGQRLGLHVTPQPWPVVQGGLVFVTLVPAALLILACRTSKTWGIWIICWIASIFLVNVFIPHLPAIVMLKGYAPGGITALLVNLPLSALMLFKARQEQLLTRKQIVVVVVAAIFSLPLSIGLAFAVARMIIT